MTFEVQERRRRQARDGPDYAHLPLVFGTFLLLAVLGTLVRGTPLGLVLGLTFVLGIAAVLIWWTGREDGWLLLLLLGALSIRLATIAFDASFHVFPKADAVLYHERAASLAESWRTGTDWTAMNNYKTAAYEVVIAPFYLVFGAFPVLARAVNVVIATLATYNVYRIGSHLFDRHAALFGALPFALLPNLVRIHGEHLREAVIILVLTQVVYLLVTERYLKPLGFAVLVAGLAYLTFLRRPTAVVLIAFIAFVALVGTDRARVTLPGIWERLTRHWQVPVALGVAGVAAVVVNGVFMGGEFFYQSRLSPEGLADFRRPWAVGGSGYLTGYTFETWWDVALFLPLGAIYFLFTPFPWQVHTPLALAATLENLLLFYPVVVLGLVGMVRGGRMARRMGLIFFLVVASLAYGLIEGNVGTALRHKAQFTWIFFVFAGPVLKRWYESRVWWVDPVGERSVHGDADRSTRDPNNSANNGPAGAR